MWTNFVLNGQGTGEVAQALGNVNFDAGLMRPWIGTDGKRYVTINTHRTETRKGSDGQLIRNSEGVALEFPVYEDVLIKDLVDNYDINVPVHNATALSKQQWQLLDTRIIKAARQRLRAWADLSAASPYSVDGMTASILEHETLTDDGEATVDMDGLADQPSDASNSNLEGLPLPITQSGFWYARRQLEISRSRGNSLRTVRAEQAGRRVAETVEKTLIGTLAGMQYGKTADYGRTPKVYGYTNFPDRTTKTDLTASASATGEQIVDDVIAMRELAYAANFYGPFALYVSTGYDAKLDDDFKSNSDKTTRQRLREIDGINTVRRLDFLTGDVMILVQMTSEVAEAVNGMALNTIQWESKGGWRLDFKTMAIYVPSLKADADGNCGIVHGTTS